MNDQLLLRRKVNIPSQYVTFLSFIHPDFDVVKDLDDYDNLYANGIIYTGPYSEKIVESLGDLNRNWIVVNEHHFDVDLSTNEGLIKNILPILYIKLNKKRETPYNEVSYAQLIEKIKISLIDNNPVVFEDIVDSSSYELYLSILGTDIQFNQTFFSIVNKNNVSLITSKILTFLSKVQTMNIGNASPIYARLITQSNRKYGKHIKQAIAQFVKSKSNKIVALHRMLVFLNQSR